MKKQLIIHCGLYKTAVGHMAKNIKVIGQTTETGDELIILGETVCKMLQHCPGKSYSVFTNNDHFVNGVRLSVNDGVIDADQVTTLFYSDSVENPSSIGMHTNGAFKSYPPGFFDAFEQALFRLL
jgi:hypothetical protein